MHTGDATLVRARRNLYLIHKYELQRTLVAIPDGQDVLIDLTAASYVDVDNIDIFNAFIKGAPFRRITVLVKGEVLGGGTRRVTAPLQETRFA